MRKQSKKQRLEMYEKANTTLKQELRMSLLPFSDFFQSKILKIMDNLRYNDRMIRELGGKKYDN